MCMYVVSFFSHCKWDKRPFCHSVTIAMVNTSLLSPYTCAIETMYLTLAALESRTLIILIMCKPAHVHTMSCVHVGM